VWWWHLALIFVIALACYLQAAGYEFVYDDKIQIVQNARIRSFSNLGAAFTENFWAFLSATSFTNYYRPLQTFSYMLGYALSGLSPSAFHWINVLLHVLASLAVYWVGVDLLGASTAAMWGALLFAVHPMHTESVTWVAGITDVGCGLFYFLSLGAYLRYRKERGRQGLWQAIALSSFLLALFYKEMALTLPLIIFLIDHACDDKGARLLSMGRLKRLIPFIPALTVYLMLRINALGAFSHATLALPIGLADRLLTMLYFVGRYIQDLFLPFWQNAYHVFVPLSRLSLREWALPALLLSGGAYLVWTRMRQDRKLLFLALFIVVTIIPVLNLSGVGQNVFTERYLYIPSAGFCLLIAGLFGRYLGERKTSLFVQGGIVLLLGFLTIERNPVWKNDKTLYVATLAVSPDATAFRNNLGRVFFSERDIASARRAFQAALDSDSKSFAGSPMERAISLLGLSAVASAEGKLDDAWNYAVEARDLMPNLGDAYQTMGVVMLKRGNPAEAEKLLRHAVELEPGSAVAHANLGTALFQLNDIQSAEKELRKAIQLDPSLPGSRVALAHLLSQTNRAAEAMSLLQEALRLDPSNPQARQLLREMNSRSGK
jgi:tetratricopeptide (TPR) repeat protein